MIKPDYISNCGTLGMIGNSICSIDNGKVLINEPHFEVIQSFISHNNKQVMLYKDTLNDCNIVVVPGLKMIEAFNCEYDPKEHNDKNSIACFNLFVDIFRRL